MNIFRLAGDMTHLASVLVLLLKIHTIKSCAGISLKTQELYAIVFATRYLDIFTDFISLYNTTMKLIFLGSSFSIVWYMRNHKIVNRSYDKAQDTFRHYFLILPCLLLALVVNEKFTFKEVMWTFSIYLEAVAILPQLVLLQRTRNIDNLTGQYVFLLGLDIWFCANIALRRLLLLLLRELEKQQEAPVTSLKGSRTNPLCLRTS
ncbi:ER lumen protein-retaining receptor isoform X2 [Hevea brasiliensis]|uniref:ER lumen protein-retaining receptor isoform X2 n=1 Tax=Hevea brasiliensis TaxID=3981 RepID=UPI0025DDA841|nr:ER lumen protein-retaining receptor isoform X2 [Hevea brasiliensis]